MSKNEPKAQEGAAPAPKAAAKPALAYMAGEIEAAAKDLATEIGEIQAREAHASLPQAQEWLGNAIHWLGKARTCLEKAGA